MRRPSIFTATATAAMMALTLAACGDKEDAQGNPLDAIVWVEGTPPSLEFDRPFAIPGDHAFRVVKEGTGGLIAPGDTVSLDYVILAGSDGSVIGSTYDGGTPEPYPLPETEPEDDPSLWLALSGQKVGADVIVAFRPKAQAAEDGSSPPERPTYLLALTIVAVNAESDSEEGAPTPVAQFDRATGEPGEPTGPELPTVTLAANGEPSISFAPDQGPPDSMITEVLIVGSGDAAVGPDATVLAHYTGWLWDGEVFDSSWGGEPRAFPLSSVIQGWREGLAGHRVGSQLLLVVPPDLAYGDDPPQGIPPGATLVFVVDILGSAG